MTTSSTTAAAVVAARPSLVRCTIVGLVAGLMSGVFGVGGGVLLVPALVLVLHFDQRLAHGTSLAAVLPIAIASLVSYAIHGEVDYTVGLFLAIGAVGGAVLGTYFLHRLRHDVLAIAFAVLLLITAARLILDHSEATGRAAIDVLGALLLVLIGFAIGALAGLLGVGGGVFMVPVMVLLFSIPSAVAKGTSLLVIVPTSIMGTWRNRTKRNVDLRAATALGLAGVITGFIGGQLSVGMSERLSNGLFAALLVLVAGRMLGEELRSWRRRRTGIV